ncbi:MAG: GNAT family N-acetyltransferase [bacterium]
MIAYTDNVTEINHEMLKGFFAGWKTQPTPEKLLEIVKNSEHKIFAFDDEKKIVVGFINAISDKVLSAYIPLLEVLPDYQHRGIGSELVKRMLGKLKDYYMVDLVCDESLQNFYEKFGMKKYSAMIKRNYTALYGIEK